MTAEATVPSELVRRYASALFDLADEKRALDKVSKDLEGLQKTISGSEKLQQVLASPVVGKAAQAGVIEGVAKKMKLTTNTNKFLGLLTQNGRLAILPQVITAFQGELARRRGEGTATVIAARKLTAAQQKSLSDQLKKTVGTKVNLDITVDPSILGGLIVKVGSRMIDSSLKTKLSKLQVAMANSDQ